MVATEVDRIITGATDDRRGKALIRAQDIDFIIAARTVDFEGFNITEANHTTRTGDDRFGHDKSICNRCAHDYQCIHTRTAINLHRTILQIIIAIRSSATKDVGKIRHVIVAIWIFAQDEECLE